jgi:hypothetical protein
MKPVACANCKQVKPLSAYTRRTLSKTGYNPQCRECLKRYKKSRDL